MDVLPILWNFSLGPLLNLDQFQAFMTLIKSLSTRIEEEHTRKLRDLSANNTANATSASALTSFGAPAGSNGLSSPSNGEVDFESLVLGKKSPTGMDAFDGGWDTQPAAASRPGTGRNSTQRSSDAATFSWSTPPMTSPAPRMPSLAPAQPSSRTITPDQSLSSFASLTPSSNSAPMNTAFSQPMQPTRPGMGMTPTSSFTSPPSTFPTTQPQSSGGIDWSGAVGSLSASNGWGQSSSRPQTGSSMPPPPQPPTSQFSTFSIAPPPASPYSSFNIAPPPNKPQQTQWQSQPKPQQHQQPQQSQLANASNVQKQGLDKFESLL